jgi:hypothetical protein
MKQQLVGYKLMDNVKVCATFLLPGSKRVVEQPCSENGETEYIQQTIRLKHGAPIVVKLLKPKPAKQSLKVTNEAYQDWLVTPVQGMTTRFWNTTTKSFRVKHHLQEIAATLGGELEDFEIMKD